MTTTSPCSGPCTACGGEGEVVAKGADSYDAVLCATCDGTGVGSQWYPPDLWRPRAAWRGHHLVADEADQPRQACDVADALDAPDWWPDPLARLRAAAEEMQERWLARLEDDCLALLAGFSTTATVTSTATTVPYLPPLRLH